MIRVGIVGQKWLAENVFKELSTPFQMVYVAAPDADDRLAQAAMAAGIEPHLYGPAGLAGVRPAEPIDLLIAAHAFVHIPAELRKGAKCSIGFHRALLPLHRGRNAVEAAVRDGDKVTGGTVYHLDEGYDTGPVAFQDWCFIERGESAADLWRRALAPMGLDLLTRAAFHFADYGFLPADEQSR